MKPAQAGFVCVAAVSTAFSIVKLTPMGIAVPLLYFMKTRTAILTFQEILMVEVHISSSDFPETQGTLHLIAQKHGFVRSESLYSDPLDAEKLLCFYA